MNNVLKLLAYTLIVLFVAILTYTLLKSGEPEEVPTSPFPLPQTNIKALPEYPCLEGDKCI